MKLHFPLLSLSLFFAACDGGKATVQLFDVGSEENLSGLTVTSNGDSDTTNSLGKGKVKVPDAGGFVIRVEDPTGERPVHEIFQNGYVGGYYIGHGIIRSSEIERISSALGTTIDPSKGIVEVSVVWLEDNADLTEMYGATVDIDASYDLAVVQDDASEVGWSLGNVPPATGGYAVVAFGNVTPGDVKVTITPPEPTATCGSWPSEEEDSWGNALPVTAGQVSSYLYLCTRASASKVEAQSASAVSAPWSKLGVVASSKDSGSTREVLRRQGDVRIPGGEGPAQQAQYQVAHYELSATPANAPTHISILVSAGGSDLKVGIDTEQSKVSLALNGSSIALAHFPDGTFGVNDSTYPGFDGLLRALATDVRLAPLNDAAYVAWMMALHEVKAVAPTRFVVTASLPAGSLTAPTLPGRLGCARLGRESKSCQLWPELRDRTKAH